MTDTIKNTWTYKAFEITTFASGDGAGKQEPVNGMVLGRLGIHFNFYDETFVVDHLQSGWACFYFRHLQGAAEFAEYFDQIYGPQLDQFEVDGNKLSNFKTLHDAVAADSAARTKWQECGGVSSPTPKPDKTIVS